MAESIFAVPYRTGASEVRTFRATNTSSTTRANVVWPRDAGHRIRIISADIVHEGATANGLEVYFGDGANIGTNAGKEICEHRAAAVGSSFRVWPDGAGPVGTDGERVSLRGTDSVAQDVNLIITYREEPTR